MLHHPISKTRVFLSYARADDAGSDRSAYDDPARSFMRRVYNRLTKAGFDVWWDMVSMPSRGEEFTAEIEAAIRSCDRFVLVVGPGAVKSGYVRAEWQYALSCCLPITPILRAGDYSLIPAEISNVNAVDGRSERCEDAALDELVSKLVESALPLGRLVNVPYLPSKFLPREKPFRAACEAVRADAIQPVVVSAPPRAAALYGYGGIGKSTLAAAVAQDCAVRRRFKDGVYWIEIGQHPEITSRQADLGALLGDSREHYTDPTAGKTRLSNLLADKQALIVLDDVWDHRVVEHFPVGSACRWLLTTRSGQVAKLVDGVDVELDLLTPEEGAQLIAMYTKGSAEDPTYLAISRELGGHTLAVTLAARRLEERGAAFAMQLLERLRRPERLFKDLRLHEDDRNLNLEKSLSLSYEALAENRRRRFRALGVLALDSTFDQGALQAVWGDEEALDTEDALDVLVRAGLVEAQGGGRFRQHRLLRAYARALAEQAGELDDASAQHYAHYQALHGNFNANQDEDRHPLIRADFENIQAALDWGLARRPVEAVNFTIAIDHYMCLHSPPTVHGERLQAALRAAEDAGYLLGQANTLRALGDWSVRRDELDAARAFYDRALALYETIGAQLGQANTLMRVGDMLVGQQLWADAIIYYEQALPIARQTQDQLGIANILYDYGQALFETGQHDAGIAALHECVAIFNVIDPNRWARQAVRRLNALLTRAGRTSEIQSDSPPQPETGTQARVVMALLRQVYAQGGAGAVRAQLQAMGLSKAQIKALLRRLSE
jgi:tetratricopeptide (TPR) repeat protein